MCLFQKHTSREAADDSLYYQQLQQWCSISKFARLAEVGASIGVLIVLELLHVSGNASGLTIVVPRLYAGSGQSAAAYAGRTWARWELLHMFYSDIKISAPIHIKDERTPLN